MNTKAIQQSGKLEAAIELPSLSKELSRLGELILGAQKDVHALHDSLEPIMKPDWPRGIEDVVEASSDQSPLCRSIIELQNEVIRLRSIIAHTANRIAI